MTSCIHNILSGQRWIEHYGEIVIKNLNDDSCHCKVNFIKVTARKALAEQGLRAQDIPGNFSPSPLCRQASNAGGSLVFPPPNPSHLDQGCGPFEPPSFHSYSPVVCPQLQQPEGLLYNVIHHATLWRKLEDIMLSVISQTQDRYCVTPLLRYLEQSDS